MGVTRSKLSSSKQGSQLESSNETLPFHHCSQGFSRVTDAELCRQKVTLVKKSAQNNAVPLVFMSAGKCYVAVTNSVRKHQTHFIDRTVGHYFRQDCSATIPDEVHLWSTFKSVARSKPVNDLVRSSL